MKQSDSQPPPAPQRKDVEADQTISDNSDTPRKPMVLDGWWSNFGDFLTTGFKQAAKDRPFERNRNTLADLGRFPLFSRFFKRQGKATNQDGLFRDAWSGLKGEPLRRAVLKEVVAKGSTCSENRTFESWSSIMLNHYGPGVTPFLKDAWRTIQEDAKLAKECKRNMRNHVEPPSKRLPPRKTIIALAAAGFIMMGLYPPWFETLDARGSGDDQAHARIDRGYSFIFSPPSPPKELWQFATIKIDGSRLLIQWSCIAVAGAAAWFLCGAPNPRDEKREP